MATSQGYRDGRCKPPWTGNVGGPRSGANATDLCRPACPLPGAALMTITARELLEQICDQRAADEHARFAHLLTASVLPRAPLSAESRSGDLPNARATWVGGFPQGVAPGRMAAGPVDEHEPVSQPYWRGSAPARVNLVSRALAIVQQPAAFP